MIFDLNGIAVSVFRKRVKNVNITVKDAKVSVSAPPWATDGEIERYLRLKEPWIRRAVAVQTERAEAENRGDEFTLLGRTYRIVRCDGKRSPTFDEGRRRFSAPGTPGSFRSTASGN
ncbi:MAG: YgjP-like metallopeptidase domain-containing protein [Christensenellales bacterium]